MTVQPPARVWLQWVPVQSRTWSCSEAHQYSDDVEYIRADSAPSAVTVDGMSLHYNGDALKITGGWWIENELGEGVRLSADDVAVMLRREFERRF